MKHLFLLPFVWILRCVRFLKNPAPFVLRCEEKIYTVPHHGRSLAEVKKRFFNYYRQSHMCPGCGRIFMPGEIVSRHGQCGIAHYDECCVGAPPDYLGTIDQNGRLIFAYPNEQSCNEMARHALVCKARDL